MIVVYGLLALAIVMVIVVTFPLACPGGCSSRSEGFVDAASTSGLQLTCPKGTKSYIDEKGRTNCCKGDVNGTQCSGRIFCSLSAETTEYPLCSKRIRSRRYNGNYPPEFMTFILRYAKSMPQQKFITMITQTLDDILKNVKNDPPKEKATELIEALQKFVNSEREYLNVSFPQEVIMYEMNAEEQTQALAEEVLVSLDTIMPLTQAYPYLQDRVQSQMSVAMCAPK